MNVGMQRLTDQGFHLGTVSNHRENRRRDDEGDYYFQYFRERGCWKALTPQGYRFLLARK